MSPLCGATELRCTTLPTRVPRPLAGVNARAQVNAMRLEGTEAKRDTHRPYVHAPRSDEINSDVCGCFLRHTTIVRKCAPLHAAVDIEIGRNVVCLLLFVQEATDQSALKIARSAFHGFFTNNSTCERHINSFKHAFSVESI